MKTTAIVSCNNTSTLGKALATTLNLPLHLTCTEHFHNGEIKVAIPDAFYHAEPTEVILLHSLYPNSNDKLIQLFFTVATLSKTNASITVILPYCAYSRSSLIHLPYAQKLSPLSIITQILATFRIKKIITLDLHSEEGLNTSAIPIININPLPLYHKLFRELQWPYEPILIAPDNGAADKVSRLGQMLGWQTAFMTKKRANNICQLSMQQDCQTSIYGKHCIIIDDIVDTASTLITAYDTIYKMGANLISAAITHTSLSGDSINLITARNFYRFYTTDSIERHYLLPFPHSILSIASLLATALIEAQDS